jgi:predicted amidohydrolase
MTDKITVCAVQFTREIDLRHSIHKAGGLMLGGSGQPDFALVGGEYAVNESRFQDPYPPVMDLAQSFQSNVVVALDALRHRFGADFADHAYESMHVFDRNGDVVAIQDKYFPYVRASSAQLREMQVRPGDGVDVFEVEGVKIGLARGSDLLHPCYTQQLREAEVLFVSTLAIDNVVLEAAKVRAWENQCYVVMACYVGQFLGREMAGNCAILAPVFLAPGMPAQARVLGHEPDEGIVEFELDLAYIRQLKRTCQFARNGIGV